MQSYHIKISASRATFVQAFERTINEISTCVPQKRALDLSPDYNSFRCSGPREADPWIRSGEHVQTPPFWPRLEELSSTLEVPRILDYTSEFLAVSTYGSPVLMLQVVT